MIDTEFRDCIPYGENLVGVIRHEYRLENHTTELLHFINTLLPSYFANWPADFPGNPPEVKFNSGEKAIWVNFQQKNEYNPLHFHHGDWSFVIWVNIPYDIKAEDRHTKSGTRFNFHYTDILDGGIRSFPIKVDENSEGKIIIFPAKLYHSVTPFFTSNGYRVSISGNLVAINNG